jgi:hypothetical protein
LKRKIILGAIVLTLLLAQQGSAVFLNLTPGARPRAMGGSFVALADDGLAIHYNPAGLCQVTDYQFHTSYQRPFGTSFLSHNWADLTIPIGGYGTLGFSFQKLGVEYKGVEMEGEKTFQFGQGFRLMGDIHSWLSLGYTLNLYSLEFAESVGGVDLGSAHTFGLNIGGLAGIWGRTRLGFMARNINNPQMGDNTKYDLPQTIIIGVCYSPYKGVTTNWDMEKELNEETQLHFGAESRITSSLNLRVGLQNNPNLYTLGMGIYYQGISFDYAFSYNSEPGSTHQFTLGYRFKI